VSAQSCPSRAALAWTTGIKVLHCDLADVNAYDNILAGIEREGWNPVPVDMRGWHIHPSCRFHWPAAFAEAPEQRLDCSCAPVWCVTLSSCSSVDDVTDTSCRFYGCQQARERRPPLVSGLRAVLASEARLGRRCRPSDLSEMSVGDDSVLRAVGRSPKESSRQFGTG